MNENDEKLSTQDEQNEKLSTQDEQEPKFGLLRRSEIFTVPPCSTVIFSNQENEAQNEDTVLIGSTVDPDHVHYSTENPLNQKKRRVVGRIPRKIPCTSKPLPKEISPAISPTEVYMGSSMPQPEFYPQREYRRDQFQGQMPQEPSVKDRVKNDIQYMIMMEREQRRVQAQLQPRQSFGQHMVAVAHRSAVQGGVQAVNRGTLGMRIKPDIALPEQSVSGNIQQNFNKVISGVLPSKPRTHSRRKRKS